MSVGCINNATIMHNGSDNLTIWELLHQCTMDSQELQLVKKSTTGAIYT